ncbi:MAG: hypothetical protein GY757_26800 [bacterium]|nr:hypothetical protein [bacterium]
MKYFSVPADLKKETIRKYDKLNKEYADSAVYETYGNITVGNTIESGRPASLLPKIDIEQLTGYIAYSRERNIAFNYTINGSTMQNKEFTPEGIREIKAFLTRLHEVGVRYLTINLPSLMELVSSMELDFTVLASTNCQITNANKALFFKKMGAKKIVTSEAITRDFKALREIRESFGDQIKILVNSICFRDCPSHTFHNIQTSCDSVRTLSDASVNYYSHRCLLRRHEEIGNLLKMSWIRPEDIKYYQAIGINYFKIQGRQFIRNGDPVRLVETYFKETYDGDLMDLLLLFENTTSFRVHIDNKKLDGYIKPFYEKDNFCKFNCEKCRYCDTFARKAIDEEKVKEVYTFSKDYFHERDDFTMLMKEDKDPQVKAEVVAARDNPEDDVAFDF